MFDEIVLSTDLMNKVISLDHVRYAVFICSKYPIGTVIKKKIDKSIDFLRGWEKKMVSIFRLRRCEKVAVS